MKKILGLSMVLAVALGSCKKNILDITPLDRVAETAVWKDEAFVKAYHTEMYNSIIHNFGVHMYSKLTDEAYNAVPNGQGPELYKLNIMQPENISRGNNQDNNFIYFWNRGYSYLRKINIFLEKMDDPNTVAITGKARLIGEAKFLRAFIYFNLISRYGGVPIVTKVYNYGDEEVFTRNTFDQCVAFIEQDLTEAIPDLPDNYASNSTNYGRATKDACYALRSRLLLYAASPLFNPTNDLAKWQKAADAAAVFVNNGDRGYSLYPDYRTLFNQADASHQNEYIFTRNFNLANGANHQAPMHNMGRRYNGYGGWWASNGPSQNLVDDYEMTNGEAPFVWTGNTKTVNLASGYNPQRPYYNRDPRFDATIIHDSTIFVAGISSTTIKADTMQFWVEANGGDKAGFDSWKISSDNPRGGYILKKFMPENAVYNWQTFYSTPWPVFRLAEIYLNYAEAMFELGDEDACRTYLNKVRARASVNMPPIPNTVTGEALRQRLINERRIELAFEGHRFFDIRRWKIATIIENRPIYGMDITKNLTTGETTYTPVLLLTKNTFEEKMYLMPVELSEVQRNSPELQTPGW